MNRVGIFLCVAALAGAVVADTLTPPAAPADVSVVAGDGYAFINWAANSEADLDSYRVYRSTTPGVYGAPLAAGLAVTEYLDEAVTNGVTYFYVVTAVDVGNNESAASVEVSGKPKAYAIHSTKKGVGNSSGNKPLQKKRVESLNASWYYAWSMDRNFEMDAAIEFAPMRQSRYWPSMAELANCGSFTHLLTYNEPDHKKTASDDKPTVQQALDFWPQFEAAAATYGCTISSPACSGVYGNDGQWVTNFMTQASTLGLQVDFMNYHGYPNPGSLANTIRNECNTLWATHGRPIWITEFNGADWAGSGSWSMEDTYTTMIELLYYFESTSYIDRYAVFPWDAKWPAGAPSHIFEVEVVPGGTTNATATLTPLGRLYAQYRNSDISGPVVNTWYFLHNKGSKKRLRNNAGVAATATIFQEDPSVEFKLVDAGGGDYFIENRDSGKRLGYTGSSLLWAASAATNSTVRWSISDDANGWDFINHVGTGKRLAGDPLAMVAGGTTGTSVQWSFVRSPSEHEVAPFEVWGADAVAGIAYGADLSGSVPDEIVGAASFLALSGPAWLNMETNGVVSGTPAVGDIGTNDWQFIVSDGATSATGTLHVAVEGKTIVHAEYFSALSLNSIGSAVFPAPQAVTGTTTGGSWYKGGSVSVDNETLRFVRPADYGGMSGCSIVFDESLFAVGAGIYTVSFNIVQAGAVNKTYVELHDLDLTAGTVTVPNVTWATTFEDPDGTLKDVAGAGGAAASLITNATYAAGATGIKTIDFEYDGSGDVLLRIGAGKNGSNEWWTNHRIDHLYIIGSNLATAYGLWAHGYGLRGADVATTNDPDGDLLENLAEFALGGNPTNGLDVGHVPASGIVAVGGTNRFAYVYPRRTDAAEVGLEYDLGVTTNLVGGAWVNWAHWIAGVGSEAFGPGFDAVTNHLSLDNAFKQRFIRIEIRNQ